MRISKVGAIFAAGLQLTLGGCASTYVEEPPTWDPKFVQSIYVIAQVCLQPISDREYVEFYTVEGYGLGGKMRSWGGGRIQQFSQTTTGQPVFEKATSRQIDLKALIISIDATEFLFSQPQSIPVVGWTPWLSPESQNPSKERVAMNLVFGKTYTPKLPDKKAPRARYKVIRLADYISVSERKRNRISEEDIPSCQ